VEINGHSGSYQLMPRPAPNLWWSTGAGNAEFIGYESLDMPMPASYFHRGGNTLTVQCTDGFGIYYDDLSLSNKPHTKGPLIVAASVRPTIFYKKRGSGMVELAEVSIRTSMPIPHGLLRVVVGQTEIKRPLTQTGFGDTRVTIEVPVPAQAMPVSLYVDRRRKPIFKGSFQPQRRWRVYAMPMEQADFGYDEVPARTLEWEDRYTDKALRIEKEFPSYSYTLDAAANLQSYLANRDEAHRKQLLDYLRNGKFGINAFYLHFFTGLASPEEIFQLLSYSLQAARRYGFTVDSAAQTDEPSVTWAFPQILAEAGIKYFADGSDPIRAPFNPIGHLNFQSPFYWEGPTGAKVLMWSGVSYTVVNDMTWGGWSPSDARTGKYAASLFGLKRSLPVFLSQYQRRDYPFDAVFLYGLHNDEVPIQHNGGADVIQRWDREYAYPKIIPATQRDYFTYITDHLGSKIRTYRGDGGAYWEDEAGADARVAAINRTSQMWLSAAEKLDSIARWAKPQVRYNEASFQDAWHNLELADDYVWSDADSMRRPYSYRTRHEEDAHRGYAEAAYRQARDLLTVAKDRISELIEADKPGVVVFNTSSQVQDGFFNFELEPKEILQDPATSQLLSCGSLGSLDGYQVVRFWASGVPALGYKFYSIVHGTVPAATKFGLNDSGEWIEGRFYKWQLDPGTGALNHLVDKKTGRDLVDLDSGYELNEYLYVTGGDPSAYYHGAEHAGNQDNRLLAADPTLPIPELTIYRQTLVGTPLIERFPWGTVITVHAQAPNTPQIVSTIRLNNEQKVVYFDDKVEKNATLRKEGVYFAFPLSAEKPKVEYQGATAWVNPETDMLPGANRQWFATRGGVWIGAMHENVGWVSVDAPLITLEDINRGHWPGAIKIRNGSLFSYVMNNYWYTDAPAQQGGHFRFRYALTSGPDVSLLDTASLTERMCSPLYVITHYHKEWRQTLPEGGAGFLQASPAGVTILTIRPAPASDAYLIRVQNTTSQELTADLQFPRVTLEDAYLASVLGDRVASLNWIAHETRVPLSLYEIKTIVVRLAAN
jgi:alpha-mannosidase